MTLSPAPNRSEKWILKMPLKSKSLIILIELTLWIAALGTIAWLWDRWMLNGPHGPYRWIGMDFAPFYVGVREMFFGVNPYSLDTLLKIQQLVYGGPALGNDPMMFVYPAWLFILIAPLSILPFKFSVILYIGTLLWGMLNVLHLIAWNLSSKNLIPHLFWLVWLTLGSLPFLIISITKGQLGYLSLIALFVSRRIWGRHTYIAGIILGLALIKPTVTVIPVIGYLLWALLERDVKFIGGFLSCIGFLFATSLIPSGNWIPGYLAMLGIKGGMPVFWSIEILPNPWKMIYALLFGVLCIYTLVISRRQKHRDLWISTTFLLGISLVPMRWIYDLYLGILIPPEKVNLTWVQSITIAFAVASPWILVFVPEAARWNTAVIGQPLIWAVCLLSIFNRSFFKDQSKIEGKI